MSSMVSGSLDSINVSNPGAGVCTCRYHVGILRLWYSIKKLQSVALLRIDVGPREKFEGEMDCEHEKARVKQSLPCPDTRGRYSICLRSLRRWHFYALTPGLMEETRDRP